MFSACQIDYSVAMNTINIHSDKKRNTISTSGTAEYSIKRSLLWEKAGHPALLSPSCLHLDSFDTNRELTKGNDVREIHNFMGIKQKYEGNILEAIPGREWSMYTHPTSLRLFFGLPHGVTYSFSDTQWGSRLSVRCDYTPEGVFKIPFIKNAIIKRMEKTIKILLESPVR